jgi:hypothetical protein
MSIDLPANLEFEIQQYALSKHISASEAAVTLLSEALKSKKRTRKPKPTDAEWDRFRDIVPGVAFFETLPEGVLDDIARASKRARSEKLTGRA